MAVKLVKRMSPVFQPLSPRTLAEVSLSAALVLGNAPPLEEEKKRKKD